MCALHIGDEMKRKIKRYKSNVYMWLCGWILVFSGVIYLNMYIAAKNWLDKYEEISFIEIVMFIPMLVHILYNAVYNAALTAGLIIGIPCLVTGAVFIALSVPYLGRMREIRGLKQQNDGYLPDDLIEEMHESGELNDVEYKAELKRNQSKPLIVTPKPLWKQILLKVMLAAGFVFTVFLSTAALTLLFFLERIFFMILKSGFASYWGI